MSKPEEWKTWEGRRVDGRFPLRQWLGGSDHSAVFVTDLPGQVSQKAAIKLIAADAATVEQQLSRLRGTAKFSHPHLIRTLEAGRCRVEGNQIVYVVMEYADEDLAQIVPQRALAPAEVSELLPPLLDALSYLHGKGYVHSRIKPSNVLAAKDQLKLSSDQVAPADDSNLMRRRRDAYDAPETAAGIVSPASDVWSVGVTLVAAMTQNVPFAQEASDPDLPGAIPEPYRGIARECLHLDPKRRCSLAEIQARLQPGARSIPAPPAPSRPSAAGVRHYRYSWRMIIPVAVVLAFAVGWGLWHKASPPQESGRTGTDYETNAKSSPATGSAPAVSEPPKPAPAPRAHDAAAAPKRMGPAGGEVVHKVVPDVPRSARNTITGTIKVSVQVDVDPSGKVTAARLKTPGPSKYFAGLALKAAQGWEFSPAEVNGQPTTSAWLLQFRFRRTSTEASPERVAR